MLIDSDCNVLNGTLMFYPDESNVAPVLVPLLLHPRHIRHTMALCPGSQ